MMKDIMKHIDKFTVGECLLLLWGKLRRYILVNGFPGYVKKQLEQRLGQCNRCGT